jgi:hypothetical protein
MNTKRDKLIDLIFESTDFNRVHDVLVLWEIFHKDKGFSDNQIKELIKILPDDILYDWVKWGFSDTVVGDKVYTFILDNKEKVLEVVINDKRRHSKI